VNRQIRLEARKVYYMQNTFDYAVPAGFCLTAYRKLVRKAGLDAEGFRGRVECTVGDFGYLFRDEWLACLRMLRHFYLYGGKWPVVAKDVPAQDWRHYRAVSRNTETENMKKIIESAKASKAAGMSWKGAKGRLEEVASELKLRRELTS